MNSGLEFSSLAKVLAGLVFALIALGIGIDLLQCFPSSPASVVPGLLKKTSSEEDTPPPEIVAHLAYHNQD